MFDTVVNEGVCEDMNIPRIAFTTCGTCLVWKVLDLGLREYWKVLDPAWKVLDPAYVSMEDSRTG